LIAGLVVWLCVLSSALAEVPSTTGEQMRQIVAAFNAHAVYPIPHVSDREMERLLGGEVVRILQANADPEQPSAAVGMMVTPIGRNALWVASQDPHTKLDPGLTELKMESLGSDRALWYGHWDLPRPVRDRQWVVDSRNNHGVEAATGGQGWEHLWDLVDGGVEMARPHVAAGKVGQVTLADLDSAIYTPVNHGSWFMVELADGRTLCGYQATSVVGGAIPSWLVTRLVLARMESMLRDLEERARTWSPAHYKTGHPPLFGGSGDPIPHF
jgi:hypothetical protein